VSDLDPFEDRAYQEYTLIAALEMMTHVRDRVTRPLPVDYTSKAYLMETALGAFVEMGELVNCTQWKPWREYPTKKLNPEQRADLLSEWADVELFLTAFRRCLFEQHGVTAEDFAQAYLDKAEEVRQRFLGEVEGREPPKSDGSAGKSIEAMNRPCSGPYPNSACSIHGVVH